MDVKNAILILDPGRERVLMCLRVKNPYLGKYNLVGGGVEAGETSEEAAYRELFEETGIGRDAVSLKRLLDAVYYDWDLKLEIYYGVLNREVELVEELNPLRWFSVEENFFDTEVFAGDGNIGHFLRTAFHSLNGDWP